MNGQGCLFSARVVSVPTPGTLEVDVSLDFNVQVRKLLTLPDVEVPPRSNSRGSPYQNALRALVVLAGGKRVLVQLEPETRDRWGWLPSLPARVYPEKPVYGDPVGSTEGISEKHGTVLELGTFMSWLAKHDYDIHKVHAAINAPAAAKRS